MRKYLSPLTEAMQLNAQTQLLAGSGTPSPAGKAVSVDYFNSNVTAD